MFHVERDLQVLVGGGGCCCCLLVVVVLSSPLETKENAGLARAVVLLRLSISFSLPFTHQKCLLTLYTLTWSYIVVYTEIMRVKNEVEHHYFTLCLMIENSIRIGKRCRKV